MKRKGITFILTLVLLIGLISGCGTSNKPNNNNNATPPPATNNGGSDSGTVEPNEPTEPNTPQEPSDNENDTNAGTPPSDASEAGRIVDAMLQQVEQPVFMELTSDQVQDMYYVDPALLDDFSIRIPMMNVKSNEIALLKAKSTDHITAIKEGLDKRALDAQRQFEQYLPDQYENAKNYRIVTEGSYVLFIISESADALEQAFHSLVK